MYTHAIFVVPCSYCHPPRCNSQTNAVFHSDWHHSPQNTPPSPAQWWCPYSRIWRAHTHSAPEWSLCRFDCHQTTCPQTAVPSCHWQASSRCRSRCTPRTDCRRRPAPCTCHSAASSRSSSHCCRQFAVLQALWPRSVLWSTCHTGSRHTAPAVQVDPQGPSYLWQAGQEHLGNPSRP